jgi:A1 cistron-splicing factor AAR2
LLEAPEGLKLGIDNTFWNTGSKFRGIQLMPMGPHYIYYSFKDENYSFRLGFFLFFHPKQVPQFI